MARYVAPDGGFIVPARPLSEEQRSAIRAAVRDLARQDFDRWRITDVVERTGVSSRTLYKYFPSKEYLLLASLLEESGQLMTSVRTSALAAGDDPAERADRALTVLSDEFLGVPEMTRGMVRALLSGQEQVAPLLREFTDGLRDVLAMVLAGGPDVVSPTDRDRAQLLQQVWFAALVSWAAHIGDRDHLRQSVNLAVTQLVPHAAG